MLPRRNLETRFWEKVAKSDLDKCWLWAAACDRYGYGRVGDGERVLGAHRVSWELHYGDIPAGLGVLHKCDTPRCVNPRHLFLGTQAENLRDMHLKGRGQAPPTPMLFGSRNGASKLSNEAVAEIRALAKTVTQRVIAERYGISPAQVSRIQTGKRRSSHASA